MHLRTWTIALAFSAGLTACVKPPSTPAPQALNVLFIVSDSLRADHLGCYGYRRATSPAIDALAREGTLFEQAYSHSSFTLESVAAIFTGVPPAASPYGVGWYAKPDPDRLHLDGMFKKAGYTTGFFSDSPMFEGKTFGQGCDTRALVPMEFGQSGSTMKLVDLVKPFLHENRAKPFMAYVHFLNPHDPYEPAPDYYKRFSDAPYPKLLSLFTEVRPHLPELRAEGFGPGEQRFEDLVTCYDGEIAEMDDGVRALLDALREEGLLDHTLIVFSADHGEEFLDHGFVEHGWSLYNEVVHVPLILWRPGLIPARRETARVSHCDLFPTLAGLAGIPCERTDLFGTALFDRHNGPAVFHAPSKPIFISLLLETRMQVHAAILDNVKYIAAPHWLTPEQCSALSKTHHDILIAFKEGKIPPPPVWGPLEHEALYDLAADPGETKDIGATDPERLGAMRRTLAEFQKTCPAHYFQGPQLAPEKALSPEDLERLQGLGYLGGDAKTPPVEKDAELERLESLGYLGGN